MWRFGCVGRAKSVPTIHPCEQSSTFGRIPSANRTHWTVLGDPRFSRAAALNRDEPRVEEERPYRFIMDMDPPEHTRLRVLVGKAFTVKRVEELRARTQEIADSLVDAMRSPADLVADFALPLPVTVICELMGVPFADRGKFQGWSESLMSTTALTTAEREAGLGSLAMYMTELIEQRRRTHTDDLLGALVLARDEDGRLSEQELLFMAMGLLAVGYEATSGQIPNFIYVLHQHPEQLAMLKEDLDLIPAAVDELMRFVPVPSASSIPRYALEDVELSGGVVRAGEPVLVSRSAANRDPRVYAPPMPSTSGGTAPHMWGSATGCTTASARSWPAWNFRSPSRPCSRACRTSTSPCPRRSWCGGPAYCCGR